LTLANILAYSVKEKRFDDFKQIVDIIIKINDWTKNKEKNSEYILTLEDPDNPILDPKIYPIDFLFCALGGYLLQEKYKSHYLNFIEYLVKIEKKFKVS
jgi:hypothetical protein